MLQSSHHILRERVCMIHLGVDISYEQQQVAQLCSQCLNLWMDSIFVIKLLRQGLDRIFDGGRHEDLLASCWKGSAFCPVWLYPEHLFHRRVFSHREPEPCSLLALPTRVNVSTSALRHGLDLVLCSCLHRTSPEATETYAAAAPREMGFKPLAPRSLFVQEVGEEHAKPLLQVRLPGMFLRRLVVETQHGNVDVHQHYHEEEANECKHCSYVPVAPLFSIGDQVLRDDCAIA